MSNWISEIQWDERGRPFRMYLMDGPNYKAGQRTYVSPSEPHPSNTSDERLLRWAQQTMASKPGKSFNHMSADATAWDSKKGEWKQSFDPTGLATVVAGGIIGAGPAMAAAGGGGAGAAPAASAAGGALPSSSIPVSAAMSGPAAIGSQGVSAGIGAGAASAAGGGGASGAAGAAGATGSNGLMDSLKDTVTDPRKLAGLAALIPALTAAIRPNNSGPFGNNSDLVNEIQKSLAIQRGRVEQAQPVYDALVRQSVGMTPKAYREDGAEQTPYPYRTPQFGGWR